MSSTIKKTKTASQSHQVDGITGRSLTFSECRRQSGNFGANLQAAGAKKGDVIALFLPNCVEFPLLLAGAAAAGVAVTTLNPVYTPAEVRIEPSDQVTIVTSMEDAHFWHQINSDTSGLRVSQEK